jgi:predicted GNAT family acetyltransferase
MSRRGKTEVSDKPDRSRYEIAVDGKRVGHLRYRRHPNRIDLIHTEILPQHEGHGYGGELLAGVLALVREEGLAVIPHCPFVRSYLERHPDDLDLVPAERRAEFGLEGPAPPPV